MSRLAAARRPFWHEGLLLAGLTLYAVLLLALFLWQELAITGGRLGTPLDDAWIHFQFARNLAEGHGFSFNPGQPTPGSTAPLWTLLLALAGLIDSSATALLRAALALSAGFFLLAVWLTFGFARQLTGRRWAALLAAAGVASTGRLLWAGLAGMETTAFAALSLAAAWLAWRRGLGLLPACLFALAGQLRPEGHALFALAWLDAAWDTWRQLPGASRGESSRLLVSRLLLPALVYAGLAAPYALFSLATTGKPLPNTFYAKAASGQLFSWRTLRETLRLHWWDNPLSLLLLPAGFLPAWRRARLAVLWLLVLPLATAVILPFVWHHGRYTMPLVPFQMLVAALGATWLAGQLAGPYPSRQNRVAALLLALFLLAGAWRLPRWAAMLGHNTREIQQVDLALGEWLAQNTPPGALVAIDDIGAATFISRRRIIDLNGLVSPEMWPAVRAGQGMPRDRVTSRILSGSRPAYLAGFPLWHWNIASNGAVARPLATFRAGSHTMIAEQEAVAYAVTWPYLPLAAVPASGAIPLGQNLALRHYALAPPQPGAASLEMTLYWQSLAPVAEDYDVFVHVLGEDGAIVAQADRQPLDGLAPTSLWQPGDVVADPLSLPLPAALSPGTYQVKAGLYLRQSGQRLAVPGSGDGAIDLGRFNWP